MLGGSFGAYQNHDLTVEIGGGPHWTIDSKLDRTLRRRSIALDAIVGLALRVHDDHGDGVLFGLALSYRFDTLENLH
jgi:hypothetical protein